MKKRVISFITEYIFNLGIVAFIIMIASTIATALAINSKIDYAVLEKVMEVAIKILFFVPPLATIILEIIFSIKTRKEKE